MTSPVFTDLYSEDLNGHPNIVALVAAGLPWAGLGLKISEGTYYPNASQADWINTYWSVARTTAGTRYGSTWFRYGYHYYRVGESTEGQGDLYLQTIENAGGWGPGDLWPMIDVEGAENPSNALGLPAQVEDEVSELAAYLLAKHGRKPLLYAGSYIRDLGIMSHMGCQLLSTAAYGSTLPASLYEDMGWSLAELFDWQYQGTSSFSGPKGYPRINPMASTPLDQSAVTICDGATPEQQLAWIAANIGH